MKEDKIYKNLVVKMQEVSMLPTQDMGRLTPFYKRIVPQFKYYPWKMAGIISLFSAFLLYFVFGALLVKLVSLLQLGF